MVKACSNCGHSVHESHNDKCCTECGEKLKLVADARDVCPEARQRAYTNLLKVQTEFIKAGGTLKL